MSYENDYSHDESIPMVASIEEFDMALQGALDPGLEGIRYEHFYRQHGARMYSMFIQPRMSDMENFMLPRKSVVHYIPESETELGITRNHLFLRRSTGYLMADHVTEYHEPEGNPIRNPVQPNMLIRKYRQANRSIRPLRNYDTVFRSDNAVAILNYAILNHLYRYRKNFMMNTYRIRNMMRTWVDTANQIAEKTSNAQFVEIKLPKIVPTKSQFVSASRGLTRRWMGVFNTYDSVFMLELWKWLGPNRSESALAGLSAKAVKAIQLVYSETGKYTVVSMDKLDSWRGADDRLTDTKPDREVQPKILQLAYLKFLNSLFVVRSAVAKTIVETEVDEEGNEIPTAVNSEGEVLELDEAKELEELEAIEEEEAGKPVEVDDEPSDEEESEDNTLLRYIENDSADDDKIEPPNDTDGPFVTPIDERTDALLDLGLISTGEKRRYLKLADKIKTIPNPYDPNGGKSLLEAAQVDPAVLEDLPEDTIPEIKTVIDKTMLKSTLKNFDANYIQKVMNADILSMAINIQKANFIVTDYRVEKVRDIDNAYEIHSVQYTPVGGSPATVRFKIPTFDKRGTFLSRGTKYTLRKQRADLPIVKVYPDQVNLTSYYSKVFVNRSPKKVYDYGKWLLGEIALGYAEKRITEVKTGNVFQHEIVVPRAFSAIAQKYRNITVDDMQFHFDLDWWSEKLGDKELANILASNEVPVATKGKALYVMDQSGTVFNRVTPDDSKRIEEYLGIDGTNAPTEHVVVRITGERIPVGFLLAYHYGFSTLLKMLKVPFRTVSRGSALDLQPDEYAIRFADQSIILSRDYHVATLMLSGFQEYHRELAKYSLMEFDSKDIYSAVLDGAGIGSKYLREFETMVALWVDPITLGILEKFREPTDFIGLLVKSVQLLSNDRHHREGDGTQRRVRGYERISGHVYSQLVRAVRQQSRRPITAKAALELKPTAVWDEITKDPALGIVNEINPVEQLKEQELLTFGGTGGRSARTMVRRTRAFDPNDMMLVSEATVDNQNVAVTTYAPPNPKLKDLRGIRQDIEPDYTANTSMLSTSSLLSPMATHDDPKRANFINIQMSHVLASPGYDVSPVRTGYEDVLAHRTDELYSYVAKGSGVVEKVLKDHIVVVYDDPNLGVEKVEIGVRYGVSTGHAIKHVLVCDIAPGTKVKAGHVLVYNSGFFARNFIDTTQVTWKTGARVKVAFKDDEDTLEDSSAISKRISELLSVSTVEHKEITLSANESIHDLVSIGDRVAVNDILCNIEDATTSGSDLFDADTRNALRLMARNSPRSKVNGTVGSIKIRYNCDLEDMTPELRAVVERYDKARMSHDKALGRVPLTGFTPDLNIDEVKIDIYIDYDLEFADGDKGVFGNQLKTVIRRIMAGTNRTESGIDIDALFGYQSVSARIVVSPEGVGTTIVLVELANKRACAAYRKK